ncbi:unnamed protein product [Mytilus coruscus]|uniref:Uncharacterized protein n=1 Tax=Mytilus coruscus TaxID=42192 RepID=A0A6J8AV55_MYTCO|nr:unnamed protein product [Mytilus coruscus]
MYSDEYEHGTVLTDRVIEDIFEQEIMKVRKSKSFMGIWQMFALSNVLKRLIFSVYPKKGNPVVRRDLHRQRRRRIESRNEVSSIPLYIMWTTTRKDMPNAHWIPNHYVPVLQIQHQTKNEQTEASKLKDKTEITNNTNKENQGDEEHAEHSHDNKNVCDTGKYDQIETTIHDHNDTPNNLYEQEHSKNENKIVDGDKLKTETKRENSTVDRSENCALEVPESCINKYVIVKYNNTPYPGYVEDGDSSDIFVVCMHRVGRKLEKNVFFWPKAIKDKCWYKHDKILAIIPEPKRIKGSSNCYEVDPVIWSMVLNKL